jgi:hypothetical protein
LHESELHDSSFGNPGNAYFESLVGNGLMTFLLIWFLGGGNPSKELVSKIVSSVGIKC